MLAERAVTTLDAEAYDGEHAQIYSATNGGKKVKIVEHLIIRDGHIELSEVVVDGAAFQGIHDGLTDAHIPGCARSLRPAHRHPARRAAQGRHDAVRHCQIPRISAYAEARRSGSCRGEPSRAAGRRPRGAPGTPPMRPGASR